MARKSTREFVLLSIGVLFFLTWLIGQRGLNEPDEGRYSNIALNFLKPGANLWEPIMSGYGHYDKPPLIYWTTALSFKVFGRNETAARLPSLFGAILTLVGLGWAAGRLYGRSVAWWAILICGTFGQFWVLARFLTPDMLLTGWCTLAVAAWAECRHRNGDWRFWFLSLLFWTLGWWTKATPTLIPLLGITTGLLILKDERGKRALRPLFILLGILVLGSVWYIKMIQEHGQLVDFFFVREMKGRVTGHVEGRKGPIYYYVGLSFLALLPWWPMALRAAVARWKRGFEGRRWTELLGIEGWIFVVGLAVFSLISSKLPTYTLPLAPWIALLFARAIVALKAMIPAANFRRWTIASGALFPILLIAVTPFAPKVESRLLLNSSLREVASTLKANGAEVVYVDRYWPSLEFYFGSKVFYVLLDDPLFKAKFHQRTDDSGIDPVIGERHFYFPRTWRESLAKHQQENVWYVHYFKANPSPFDQLTAGTNAIARIEVGNFVLLHVAPETVSAFANGQKF